MEDSFRFKFVEYREPKSTSKTLFKGAFRVCLVPILSMRLLFILCYGIEGKFYIHGSLETCGVVDSFVLYNDFPTESTFLYCVLILKESLDL